MSSEVLRKALATFGEIGENWTKRAWRDDHGCFCSLGAVAEASWGNEAWGHNGRGRTLSSLAWESLIEFDNDDARHLANAIRELSTISGLDQTPEAVVVEFNDNPATTFADVKRVFERAIELADAE